MQYLYRIGCLLHRPLVIILILLISDSTTPYPITKKEAKTNVRAAPTYT